MDKRQLPTQNYVTNVREKTMDNPGNSAKMCEARKK